MAPAGWASRPSGYTMNMPAEMQGSSNGAVEWPGHEGFRLRLGSGPEAAAEARSAIAKLGPDLDPPLIETLRLLVTELVTNSVRHTECDAITLKVVVGSSAVLTEVTDDGPVFDPDPETLDDPDRGWGLFLVQMLAPKWGVRNDGGSKHVWFELNRA